MHDLVLKRSYQPSNINMHWQMHEKLIAPTGSCSMCVLFDETSQELPVTWKQKHHCAEAAESSTDKYIYIQ